MVVIDADGSCAASFPFKTQTHRFCVFEYIYFARPGFHGGSAAMVYEARKRIGNVLAEEALPPLPDMVIPVPDSLASPRRWVLPTRPAFPFRSWALSATIMSAAPSSSRRSASRHLGVRLKHSPNRAKLKGQRVILVDDSIVRGTTSKKIVEMVRDAGALEVHFRVASPPTTHSCFYGVDTPDTNELLAHRMDVEEMRKFIGADSLAFISMNGLYRAMGTGERIARAPSFCDACFSGDYPIALTDQEGGSRHRQLSLLADVALTVSVTMASTLAQHEDLCLHPGMP